MNFPTNNMLSSVPIPIFCFNIIPIKATNTLVNILASPIVIPVTFDIPWWKTSHGDNPKLEFNIKTVELAHNKNPNISLIDFFNIIIKNFTPI